MCLSRPVPPGLPPATPPPGATSYRHAWPSPASPRRYDHPAAAFSVARRDLNSTFEMDDVSELRG